MSMDDFEVIRGDIDRKHKYCRIPVKSKMANKMQEYGFAELSAEIILAMPHDEAVKTIDAIMADWMYWLRRAGELFILYEGVRGGNETPDDCSRAVTDKPSRVKIPWEAD